MTPQAKEAREKPSLEVLQTELKFYREQCEARGRIQEKQQEQIDDLEKKKERLMGALAVLTFLWPFFSHKIGEVLGLFGK